MAVMAVVVAGGNADVRASDLLATKSGILALFFGACGKLNLEIGWYKNNLFLCGTLKRPGNWQIWSPHSTKIL